MSENAQETKERLRERNFPRVELFRYASSFLVTVKTSASTKVDSLFSLTKSQFRQPLPKLHLHPSPSI